MATITNLIKQKKNKDRYNIYIDEEYYCSLNIEQITIHQICIDQIVKLKDFDDIVKSDNIKYAFNLAIKYISFKRRTIKETADHLASKGLDDDVVLQAIKKVKEYGYLNDAEYAKEFISFQINQAKYGKAHVKNKLKQRGIKDDILNNALNAFDEDTETRICWAVYGKLYKKYENQDPLKTRQKIYRSLMSKGFTYDIIKHVINYEE
jgi:regulatory protein